MAYYNPYQQNYQPNYQPFQQSFAQPMPSQQPQIQQPLFQSNNGINWVQGEAGAKAYPVAANNSVLLMDSEGQYFYIKSADQVGMPMMKKFTYSEIIDEPLKLESHEAQPQQIKIDTDNLATKEDIKNLEQKIESISMRNNQQKQQNNGGQKNG